MGDPAHHGSPPPDPAPIHDMRVELVVSEGLYRARCDCGWEGEPNDRAGARRDARRHGRRAARELNRREA